MITVDKRGSDEFKETVISVPDSLFPKFAELIQRGSNLWPDAPPEIKEFADLVTNGKVLQNYREQNKDQRKTQGTHYFDKIHDKD